MRNILYITDNPADVNTKNVTVVTPDELSVYSIEPHSIIIGRISTVDNAETAKKYIIDKKIKGAFITVNIQLGDNGKLFKEYDNNMVKKMKEVCLFADLITLNYTEAMIFSNIPYIENCEEKDIKRIIFMLNSYGMVNRIIISDIPYENKAVTVISELGEFDVVDKEVSDVFYFDITNEILNGKKLNEIIR